MFFIPIAAVVVVVWLICQIPGAVNKQIVDRDVRNYQQATDLVRQYTDSDLENDLTYQLRERKIDAADVVCSFMGGQEIWRVYTDMPSEDGRNKALLVLMAERGKLPLFFSAFPSGLHLSERVTHKPGKFQIRPAKGFCMNEEFVLAVEKYLHTNYSMPVSVYCRADLPDGRKNVQIRVRDLTGKYGFGLTRYFTTFQFLYDNDGR